MSGKFAASLNYNLLFRYFQDENGRICEFTVLARPPNAVAAMKEEMMKKVPPRLLAAKAKNAVKNIFGK